ncbi:MAG: tRNA lysidine(34) synthetase TilS [Alphaproteobacteria bacterium]|nr:tRNA lysidine(34) synthetase TilS [Alphaproteobacteria bacterium]
MAALQAPWPAAVAVSGGGDSLALMLLLAEWAREAGKARPVVLTVDHGLRPSSKKDAERVRKVAGEQGLEAHMLAWKGPKPVSDVEAESRTARYSLMGGWCADHGVKALYAGHTLDDQAETFLLRLARGSGLDGLAAMRPESAIPIADFRHIALVRPMLEFARRELRDFLEAQGIPWSEDPMNADLQFSRARVRAAWPQLTELGLTPERLADAAQHLGRVRMALDALTHDFLNRAARFSDHSVALDPVRLKTIPREIGLRALAKLLCLVSGEDYRPRFDSLERLFDAILGYALGGGMTLHGCIVAPAPAESQVFGSATVKISKEAGRRPKEPATGPERTKANIGRDN